MVLAALSLFILWDRVPSFGKPVNNDLTIYAVIAHELGKGRLLYSDLWDQKPPAIHATYLLAEKWVGYGPAQFFALGALAAILTLLGVFMAGYGAGGLAAGYAAAFFWALFSADVSLEADQPNVEVFVNVLTTAMLALALSPAQNRGKPLAFGLLGALASLYKPQALAWTLLLASVDFFPIHGARTQRDPWKTFASMVLPTFLAWGALWLYFGLTRPLHEVQQALFDFNAFYIHDPVKNFFWGFVPSNLFPKTLWPLAVWFLLFLGTLFGLFRGNIRAFSLLGAYALASYLAVTSTGYFFPHYYQYWLPLLAVSGGWAVAWILRNQGPWLAAAVALGSGAFWAFQEIPKIPPPVPTEGYALGVRAGRLLGPGEDFFVFGNGAPAYFASRRSPPTGFVYLYPVLVGPKDLVFQLRHRLMTQLELTRPELISIDHPFGSFYDPLFSKTYRLWEHGPGPEDYLLAVRRGGTLEKRLFKAKTARPAL